MLIAGRQHGHARFHHHQRIMGLLLCRQISGLCLCCENQVTAEQGCRTFPFQTGAHRVLRTGNGSHAVAKIRHQHHLFVRVQFFHILEMNLRRVHIRACECDVRRTCHQCAAVFPVHIGKGQFAGLVLRRCERNNPAAGRQLTGDVSVNRHTSHRRIAVRSGSGFRCHIFQRGIGLQQRHVVTRRHHFRCTVRHVKTIRAKRLYAGVIIFLTAAIKDSCPFGPVNFRQGNGRSFLLTHFI